MPYTARFLTCLLCISYIFLSSTNTSLVYASGRLDNPKDIINNDIYSADNVDHIVSFTLPYDSQQISANDYIIIDLTNYTNVTAANAVAGNYVGTPSFSLNGTKAIMTGIVVYPGNSISILGITATNPVNISLYDITIIVSDDSEGLIIKNIATVTPSLFGGTVSVTASIAPAVASIVISGYAAPGTFITFTENGSVIGTDTAGFNQGQFLKRLIGLDPGTHTISLYGVDQENRTTAIFPIEVLAELHQQTTVSDILLSPTIEIGSIEIVQGENIIAQGSTIPSGELSLFTESPLRTYYATAAATGYWDYTITNTNEYVPGDYRVYSLVQNGSGLQSLFSNSIQFSIFPSSGPTPSPPACNVSQGDLNCDGNINLTDFSILMYYWGTTNTAADSNGDGIVNLIDFSIMMYYWGT